MLPPTLPGRLARSLAPLVAALLVACGVPESALDLNGWPTLGPPPPPAVSATVGDATVTVAWESVEGAIGYHLYYSDTAPVTLGSTRLEDVTPPVTLNGLQNGATYYVAASARNAAGESALSSMVEVTPVAASAAPPPPGEVVVEPGDGTAVVSWAVVADAASYNLYYVEDTTGVPPDDGAAFDVRVEGVTSPYTVSGLSNGVAYHFVVTSVNTAGESAFTAVATSAPVAAVEPPPTPTGLAGTVGDGQVALTWTPVAGASGYRVFYSDVPPATVEDPMVAATSSNATVTGLTNGTSYYVGVQAWNSAGASEISDRVVVTPVPVPGVVGGVSVEGGDGQALLNWSAVPFASDYVVYYGKTSPVTTSSSAVPSSLTERVVQGLDNDDTYYFRVAARNATGTGELSDEVWATPTVPLVPPGPPQNVVAAVGDGQATVSWSSVASATSYRVYYSTSAMVTTDDAFVASSGSPQIVSPLTNHQTYNFAVQARNSAGESALSAQVSTTPIPVPPQPAPPALLSGDGRLTATWSPVSGATSYVLYYSSTSPVTTGSNKIEGAVSEQEVLGLVNGTTYYFALAGRNAAGEGPLSAEASRAPIALPSKPGGVTATARDGHVIVDWSPSTGADEYFVFVSTSSPVSPTSYQQAFQADAGPAYIGPVTNGTPYYFVVVGRNASGDGVASDEVSATPMPAPGIPGDFNAVAGDAEVTLTWALDAAAEDYAVYWGTTSPVGLGHPFIEVDAPPLVVSLLDNGTTYYFKVVARNAYGESVFSPQRSATPRGVPDVPHGLTVTAIDTPNGPAIDVEWSPASHADTYALYYGTTSPVTTSHARITVSGTSRQLSLDTTSTWYFAVAGVNLLFEGDLSGTVGVTPGVPLSPDVYSGDQRLDLYWDVEPYATAYDVYYATEPIASKLDGTVVSTVDPYAVLQGLQNDTTYYVRIAARNAWGESALSESAQGTPRYDGPIVTAVFPIEVNPFAEGWLNIYGEGFFGSDDLEVRIAGQVVEYYRYSDSWLEAVVPYNTPHGWQSVRVSNTFGGRTREQAFVSTFYAGAARRTFPLGPNPRSIASGDLDGDGNADLVVLTNSTPHRVIAVFGDGEGGSRSTVGVGALPPETTYQVRVADLDDDGRLDIVASTATSLVFFFGDGAGGFSAPVTLIDGHPDSLAVGDFNGDGHVEVVVGQRTPASSDRRFTVVQASREREVRVVAEVTRPPLEGEGDAPLAVAATSLALGDFNGDGKLDVAIAESPLTLGPSGLVIYHGDGEFSFEEGQDLGAELGLTSAAYLVAGSFIVNGRDDLVFTIDNQLWIAAQSVLGTVVPVRGPDSSFGSRSPVLHDIDRDGWPEILVAGTNASELWVFPNRRDGTVGAPWRLGAPVTPHELALVDFNGDGAKDIAIVPSWVDSGRVVVLFADEGHLPGTSGWHVDVLNPQHTRADLAVMRSGSSSWHALTGSSVGALRRVDLPYSGFGTTQDTTLQGARSWSFATGNIDGDNWDDVVVGVGSSANPQTWWVDVYRGTSSGLNLQAGGYALPSRPGQMVLRDVNDDDRRDLFVALPDDGLVRVFQGAPQQGGYAFVHRGDLTLGSEVPWNAHGRGLAVADLDWDGYYEVLVVDEAEGTLSIQWGDSWSIENMANVGPPQVLPVCAAPRRVVVGSFYEAWTRDIAITCGDDDAVVVIEGPQEMGELGAMTTLPVGWSPVGVAAVDLDGDELQDLVVLNTRGGSATYLLASGGGEFADGVEFAAPGWGVSIATHEGWWTYPPELLFSRQMLGTLTRVAPLDY